MADMTAAGDSIETIMMIGLGAAFVLICLAGFVAYRAERARAKAVAATVRLEERVKAAEATAADLSVARHDADRLGREVAALASDAANAKARIAALIADVAKASSDLGSERGEKAGLERTLERERAEARGLEREIANLKEAKEQMRQSFNETANALLQQHSETFKAQNSEQIGHLLGPLKNDIDAFKKTLGEAHVQSAAQHGSLKQQIEGLSQQSAAVSKEAENLTRALKGNVQMQGAWGEMVLETVLQRLGMREGEEYTRQESHSDESGRVRTDYIFNLPQGDKLIIDSKVSLVDFEAYANAPDEIVRKERLAAHVKSMRNHVRGLAAKNYADKVGTRIDFVVMFLPIEAALGAALSHDGMLAVDALELKVAIATPTTLNTTLQIVAAAWRVERQNRHAEDIARRAGLLYDKFCGFVGDLDKIGDRLRQTQTSYDDARRKLTAGSGNLVKQAETLRAMGAKTSKALAAPLLEEAGAGDFADGADGADDDAAAGESAPRAIQ